MAATLPTFTDLLGQIRSGPSLLHTDFLANPNPYPTGPIDTGGGQSPDPTGPVYSGGGTAPPTTTASTGSTLCPSFNILNPFCYGQLGSQASACIGDFLLRMGLFILGLMLVAGAIYLYKGSGILALPAKAIRGTVKAGTSALKAAGESE